eukprot:gene1691-biopygen9490
MSDHDQTQCSRWSADRPRCPRREQGWPRRLSARAGCCGAGGGNRTGAGRRRTAMAGVRHFCSGGPQRHPAVLAGGGSPWHCEWHLLSPRNYSLFAVHCDSRRSPAAFGQSRRGAFAAPSMAARRADSRRSLRSRAARSGAEQAERTAAAAHGAAAVWGGLAPTGAAVMTARSQRWFVCRAAACGKEHAREPELVRCSLHRSQNRTWECE